MIGYITGLLAQLCAWICSWFSRRPRPLQTVYLEELPEKSDPKAVYVLGEGQNRWFVSFLCPCGCGAMLQMSLLSEDKPHWRLIVHPEDGTISIHPSVWRHTGCHSHFFLRRGLIEWCGG
jgi:hypothetical protein